MIGNKVIISPFKLLDLVRFDGLQRTNEHGIISFSGHIAQEDEEECLAIAMTENPIIQISVQSEAGEREIFFSGVLVELKIEVENQLKLLSATIMTGSYLMDLTPHIRSFQASKTSYKGILNILNKGYKSAAVAVNIGGGKSIDGLVLQYLETDWAFAKRMASRFNTVLISNGQSGYPYYDFGLRKCNECVELNSKTYIISKDIGRFLNNKGNGVNVQAENEMLYYEYDSREIYALGQKLIFNNQSVYVGAIETKLTGGELCHTYYLASEAGLSVPETYNTDVIGVSLSGKVKAVQKDSVQISINKDENAGACGRRWFPDTTVYSSPDGTGWYCMPEIGDAVRLYLPCERESKACVASSAHLQSSKSDARSNPDYKSIMNKQGKEVLFTPDSLLLTNNAGMSIELSDAEGIKIISDKAIQIKSDNSVDITSASSFVLMTAPDHLTFNQGGTQVKLQDQMRLKGAQIKLE